MRKKIFKKIVKYKEPKERLIVFDIKNRWQKVYLIIAFIVLFPMTAVISWIAEFSALILTKRNVHWEEISQKNSKANKK